MSALYIGGDNSRPPIVCEDHSISTQSHSNGSKARPPELGELAPILGTSGRRLPDRRRVSIRWMLGSVLTGLTSMALMGGALHAALDGRQQLAQPASILEKMEARIGGNGRNQAVKGDRPVALVALQPAAERVLQVPTMTRVGDSDVIRKKPFGYASAPLAVDPTKNFSYPAFNPLTVFRQSNVDTQQRAFSDVIYGANIESEVRIQTVPFPLESSDFDKGNRISALEAERIIREARESLTDGELQIAAMPYLDDTRFELKEEDVDLTTGPDIKIIAENVSTAPGLSADESVERSFREDVIRVENDTTLATALSGINLNAQALSGMTEALTGEFGAGPLDSGTVLRVAYEQNLDGDSPTGQSRIAQRISVYRGGNHIKTVALNDEDTVVWAPAPAPISETDPLPEQDGAPVINVVALNNLPTAYDGIYKAALSQGMNKSQARRIIRTVAFDVDFRSRIKSKDSLEIFYSLEEGLEEATEESEILYIGLEMNGTKRRYYRYRVGDTVDYYDSEGKSAKKFLLRKPVPNAKFGSAFGPRRHPISRVVKMHQGVDFSAPRGTPIIAAGNGVVEKAGWAGGYGRQTIVRHANGYKTSYSHQHRFAKGIKPGARVRLGQIIGQVGSTGYSTGPHLHYEMLVNGRRVNPMKIRLPNGNVLSGTDLSAFKQERARIDALLLRARDPEQTIASIQ